MKNVLVALIAILCFQQAFALTQPDWNLTPGILCSADDPDFSKYDYPENIARCDRNVNAAEKRQVAKN